MTETYAESAEGPAFDHSVWNDLLQQHVDADGWVDYLGFQRHERRLDEYLQSLAEAPFEDLGRDEKLALLINAYNAFTVRLILDHWPVESIKDIPTAKRWAAVRWKIGGSTWSLEQIEHEQIRPHFREPRIHFALVCAAVGCPPLRNEAFTAAGLEDQLEAQSLYVHAHRTWVQYDGHGRTLRLTSLYDWYAGDFEQSAASVIGFVSRYHEQLPEDLATRPNLRLSWLPYDWALNDVSNRGPR